jgi:hypothetical protein
MKKEILSEELNAMKYLLGHKRGVVISEQQTPQFGNPNQFSTNPFAPKTQATNTQSAADIYNEFQRQNSPSAQIYKDFQAKYGQQPQASAPTTAPATPATAAPTTPAPATNLSVPDLIKEIQKILKDKYKANLGTSGPNKDGIDGVWGKNTQSALESAIKTLPAAPTTGAPAAAAPTTGAPAAAAPTTQFKTGNIPTEIGFKPSTPKL